MKTHSKSLMPSTSNLQSVKNDDSSQQNIYIGINSIFLYQSFTLKYVPLGRHSNYQKNHLLINKQDTLIVFSQKQNKILGKVHMKYDLQLASLLSQVAYWQRHRVFFVLLQNGKTIALDQKLKIIKTLTIGQFKHSLEMYMINQIDVLLMIKPDSIFMVSMNLFTNHERIKSKTALTFNLELGSMNKLKSKLQFTQGFKFFFKKKHQKDEKDEKEENQIEGKKNDEKNEEQNIPQYVKQRMIMIIYSSVSVEIYYIYENQELIETKKFSSIEPFFLENVIEEPDSMTCLVYLIQQNILMVGTQHGEIIGYQVFKHKHEKNQENSQKRKFEKQKDNKSVHSHNTSKGSSQNFRKILKLHAHTRKVLSLQLNKNNKIVSHGADDNIHLVDLDSMTVILTFRLDFHSINSIFLSEKVLMTLSQSNQVNLNKIKIDHKIVYNHNCTLVPAIDKIEDSVAIIGFSDNSLINFTVMKKQQKTKVRKQHILNQTFTPPKCKQILCFVQNPYEKRDIQQTGKFYREYWLLTDKAQIYKYQLSSPDEKMKIKQVAKVHHFYDKFDHEFFYQPNVMDFLSCVPIRYDSDVIETYYEPNKKSRQQVRPICLGCIQGYVIVLSSKNLQDIIFKICPFNLAIQTLFQLSIDCDKSFIITISKKQFIFTEISPTDQPIISHRIMLKWESSIKKLRKDCAALIDGNTMRLIFSMNNFLLSQNQQNVAKSEGQITYVNFVQAYSLVVTGDKIGNIVIWNLDLQIQKKVILTQAFQIQYVSSMRDTLFFGYKKKIYQISIQLRQSIVFPHLEYLIDVRKSLQSVIRKQYQFEKDGKVKFRFAKKIPPGQQNVDITSKGQFSPRKSKDFSLPSINQSYRTINQGHQSQLRISSQSQDKLSKSQIRQLISRNISPKRMVDIFERQKRKKERNKSVSFIFHFPNSNVYRQLIKKKLVDK